MVKIPIKAVYELKLYNTYYICNNLAGVLKGLKVSQNTEQNNVYYIENWDEYTNALKTLRTIPIFKDISDKLYELIPVFIRSQPRPSIDTQTRNNLISANNNLICRIDTIIELYTSMNIPEKEKGIDVKIPNCQDLKEYIKYLNDIDFVFSQCPYLLHKDETIKFSSVDVGSNWLTFVIEVSAGATGLFYILNNLAKIVDKAMILKSHYCSIKEQEEALKSIQLKSDLAKGEKEIFDTLKKHYMNEVTTSLENEIAPLEDGEQRGKLEKSLEKLSNLLDKGVEIYASLDTPKNVQLLFPAIDEQEKLSDSVLNYLEDKKEQGS